MSLFTILFSLLFVDFSIAGYVLEDDYSPSKFFDMFSFWTEADPTHGFVDYVDRSTAQSEGYISTTASTVYIGTDHENITPNGRPSIRLTSNKAYNSGSLVILDLGHMPGSICGAWPAYWMLGPDWPSGGEIDIIEGVNEQTTNAMTLHTDAGCTITNNGNFTGSISTYNCDVNAFGQVQNAGCSIGSHDTQSYGNGLNSIGGGVYATEWTDTAISIWFFARGSIPGDITAGSPNPSTWGKPTAQFQGGCDIPEFFHDNQIVFDLTYCGDWAGNVWSTSSCKSKANTCIEYVRDNPSAFKNAYWSINSLKAYQYSASTPYSTSSVVQSSTRASISLSAGISTSSSAKITSSATSTSFVTSSKAASSSITSSKSVSTSATTSISPSSSEASSSERFSFSGRWSSTGIGKAVTHITTASTGSSQASSTGSSSITSTTVLSVQSTKTAVKSSYTGILGDGASGASTVALPTSRPSTGDSVNTAVPTSPAEIAAKAKAMADEWSRTAPSDWQDNIDRFEDAMAAAASQAAAVSARLKQKQNQRRHLLQHKKRLNGHH